jgi:hypothetical protein
MSHFAVSGMLDRRTRRLGNYCDAPGLIFGLALCFDSHRRLISLQARSRIML